MGDAQSVRKHSKSPPRLDFTVAWVHNRCATLHGGHASPQRFSATLLDIPKLLS